MPHLLGPPSPHLPFTLCVVSQLCRPPESLNDALIQLPSSSIAPSTIHRRSLSLWPSSAPKAEPIPPTTSTNEDLLAESALSTRPLESQPTPVPAEQPPALDIDPAVVSPPGALEDKWELARQILAEHDLGHGIWIGKLQHLLEYVHLSTGYPWYLTIIVFAAFIRISVFPLLGRAVANGRRMANLKGPLQPLMLKNQQAAAAGDRPAQMAVAAEMKALFVQNNVNPLRSFIMPIVMIPIGFGAFFAIRGMYDAGFPGFHTGGTLWFPDLSKPDPYYVLPVTSASCQILALRAGAETGKDASMQTPQEKAVKKFFEYVMIATIPITSFMPAVRALALFYPPLD